MNKRLCVCKISYEGGRRQDEKKLVGQWCWEDWEDLAGLDEPELEARPEMLTWRAISGP